MHRRIQELARGQFNGERPQIELSVPKIEIRLNEGQDHIGEFEIISKNKIPMRGSISSSNVRMECQNTQFEGERVVIRYQFHSEGLNEGNIQKGDFYIICNGGEYNLSFVVYISKKYARTSIGTIKKMSDFVELVRENELEASQVFLSQPFQELLTKEDETISLFYKGLYRQENVRYAMEEFLCSIHRKERVRFEVCPGPREFETLRENVQEMFTIRKNTWGYLRLSVRTDATFLEITRKEVEPEDFSGSMCNIPFVIHADRLHPGKNYARVRIESAWQTEEVVLCISQPHPKGWDPNVRLEIRKMKVELMQLYASYRLRQCVTGEWCQRSVVLFEHLSAWEDKEFYRLLKAQAYLINRQKQEAEWILDEFARKQKENQNTVAWGYYCYLQTLMEQEPSFVDKMTKQVEQLYEKLHRPPVLFWTLLFLEESYEQNYSKKWRAIEEVVDRGCHSPYLYIEAYYLLAEEPYLLQKLNGFERQVLNWAGKYNCLTREIVSRVLELAKKEKRFHPAVYRLLCQAYQKYPSKEVLETICIYLIQHCAYKTGYFEWFDQAICQGLRIPNLYEGYMMCLDARKVVGLPKEIQLYFQYNNTLTVAKKSLLYVNLIAQKEKEPRIYEQYKEIIREFALAQIRQHHIDDNLAVIYEDLLQQEEWNKELANDLAELLYTCRFTCRQEGIRYVVLIQRNWQQPIVVPVVDQVAYLPIYHSDHCVLLENMQGYRMSAMDDCQIENLMHPSHYLRKCIEFAPQQLPYQLHYFETSPIQKAIHTRQTDLLQELIEAPAISQDYRKELYRKLVIYCYENDDYELLRNSKIAGEDFMLLDQSVRIMAVESLVELKEYEAACRLLPMAGTEFMQTDRLLELCTYELGQSNQAEDPALLAMCQKVFRAGRYNESVLKYLEVYAKGPTKELAKIFFAATEAELDVSHLTERLLLQMLFTEEFVERADEIYRKYLQCNGRKQIKEAYLSYYAHCSFVQKMLIPDEIYQELFEFYQQQRPNDICKLALLQYLSQKEQLSGKEHRSMEILLEEFLEEGMYFAFYKQFDRETQLKYHMYDKCYVEYRTRPGTKVRICYQIEDIEEEEFQKEEMHEVFEGIYVKCFVLFFGEKLQYYVEEIQKDTTEITESNVVQKNEGDGEVDESRYDYLNAMAVSETLEDHETLRELAAKYQRMEQLVEEVFKVM